MFDQMQVIPYKSKWEAGSPNLTNTFLSIDNINNLHLF